MYIRQLGQKYYMLQHFIKKSDLGTTYLALVNISRSDMINVGKIAMSEHGYKI